MTNRCPSESTAYADVGSDDRPVTVAAVMSHKPCWPHAQVKQAFGGAADLTVTQILRLAEVAPADRLWAATRDGFLSDSTLRLFAVACADRALRREREQGREPDARSWAAIRVARRFARGRATAQSLAAAWAAAGDAARAVAGDAARAARAAAWAARAAAGDAARATWAAGAAAWAARAAAWAAARDAGDAAWAAWAPGAAAWAARAAGAAARAAGAAARAAGDAGEVAEREWQIGRLLLIIKSERRRTLKAQGASA